MKSDKTDRLIVKKCKKVGILCHKWRIVMKLTKEQVQADIDALPKNYKTKDVDKLIKRYVKEQADVSVLREYVLLEQQFHRIYYYVTLNQIKDIDERMKFIHNNLLFNDWWHTDELIGYVCDLNFEKAFSYAKNYVKSTDPFIRRWGYVMFISKQCIGHAKELLQLMHNDEHYYVQMAEAWLITELAVFEPEVVYEWFLSNELNYNINGKVIQKISDSYRISEEWKEQYKGLRNEFKKKNRQLVYCTREFYKK